MKETKPNIAVEVFLSLVKWFLIFVIVNNLIWAALYFHNNGSVELSQDEISAIYNNQSVTNGKTND